MQSTQNCRMAREMDDKTYCGFTIDNGAAHIVLNTLAQASVSLVSAYTEENRVRVIVLLDDLMSDLNVWPQIKPHVELASVTLEYR